MQYFIGNVRLKKSFFGLGAVRKEKLMHGIDGWDGFGYTYWQDAGIATAEDVEKCSRYRSLRERIEDSYASGNRTFGGADFGTENLQGIYLRDAFLHGAKLQNADLSGANLSRTKDWPKDISGSTLVGADLRGLIWSGIVFVSANLENADFSGSKIRSCIGSTANLSYADLTGCDLYNVNFRGADLSYAKFTGASIRECNFDGAVLTGVEGLKWT